MPKANSKSKKTAPKTVVEKKPEPVVDVTPTTTVPEIMKYSEDFDKIFTQLQGMKNSISQIISDTKKIQKAVQKDIKSAERKQQRAGSKKGKREPSGFAKPAVISNELCDFLGKPYGTEMARTDVTKEVNKYNKEHNLQNPENKKEIKADSTLTKLLNLKKGDGLNYFSLQKYLKDHFPKEDTTVST